MALGQILSQSISRNENFVAPAVRSPASLSKNVNRLISAAVVSPRFRHLLFSDPIAALAAGYNGESFQLTQAEYTAVTSLHVNSVRDFAAQLLHMLQFVSEDATPQLDNGNEQPSHSPRRPESDNTFSRHAASFARHNLTAGDGYRSSHPAQRYGA